jgi:hypothetical protein
VIDITAGGLRLADALALSLKHDLAFKLRKAGEGFLGARCLPFVGAHRTSGKFA